MCLLNLNSHLTAFLLKKKEDDGHIRKALELEIWPTVLKKYLLGVCYDPSLNYKF